MIHYINFDKLVERARTSGNAQDLNELYKNFLSLPEWIFITSNRPDIENAKPFVGIVDEQPWLFIFTDSLKARAFCEFKEEFTSADGSTFFIKMQVKKALDMVYKLGKAGVYGIIVNEGKNSWYCSIDDLPKIIEHLRIKI